MIKSTGKSSKLEMIAKLTAMKLELAKKKKKLKKSQRVAHIKAHVQQKLKEHSDSGGVSVLTSDDSNLVINENDIPSPQENERHSAYPWQISLEKTNRDEDCQTRMSREEANTDKDCQTRMSREETNTDKDCQTRMSREETNTDKDCQTRKSREEANTDKDCQTWTSLEETLKYSEDFQLDGKSVNVPTDHKTPLISYSSRSDENTNSPMKYCNNQVKMSDSQFLEILGVSQPLDSIPLDSMKWARSTQSTTTLVQEMRCMSKPSPKSRMVRKYNEKSHHIQESNPSSFQSKETHDVDNGNDISNLTPEIMETDNKPVYEYTELDAISFSHFEFTDDFLSENPCSQKGSEHSHGKVKRVARRSLIQRKSPRLSAISHNARVTSVTANSSPENPIAKRGPNSRRRQSLSADEKSAAVLSAFQYLIDEVKRKGLVEFSLPSSVLSLMNSNVDGKQGSSATDVDERQGGTATNVDGIEENPLKMSPLTSTNINIKDSESLFNSNGSSESVMRLREYQSEMKDADRSSQIPEAENSEMESPLGESSLNILPKSKHYVTCSSSSCCQTQDNCTAQGALKVALHGTVPANNPSAQDINDLKTMPKTVSLCCFKTGLTSPCQMQHSSLQCKKQNQNHSEKSGSCLQSSSLDDRLNCDLISDLLHEPSLSSTPIRSVKQKARLSRQDSLVHCNSNIQGEGKLVLDKDLQPNHSSIIRNPRIKVCEGKDFDDDCNEVNLEDLSFCNHNPVEIDTTEYNQGKGDKLQEMLRLASPISRCSPEIASPKLCKISKNPSSANVISESEEQHGTDWHYENSITNSQQTKVENFLPRPIFSPQNAGCEEKKTSLYFIDCFQSCSQEAVVQIFYCQVPTSQVSRSDYIICVQASALTVWLKDAHQWSQELEWRLSSNVHIHDAFCLPPGVNKIRIAAYGWEGGQLFASNLVYDVNSGRTSDSPLPVSDGGQDIRRNLDKLYFCCAPSSHLLIGVSYYDMHTIRSICFSDDLESITSTLLFQPHRGSLKGLQVCHEISQACITLTGDQKIFIWNLQIASVIRSIQMPRSIPCLTRLLRAKSFNGYILLTASWTEDKFDFVGVVVVNPVTGRATRLFTHKNPNSGWKRLQCVHVENQFVVAVSHCGSVAWWDHMTGTLIGYRKSRTATCATVIGSNSLVIGELEGCLHSYALP